MIKYTDAELYACGEYAAWHDAERALPAGLLREMARRGELLTQAGAAAWLLGYDEATQEMSEL